MYKYYGRGTVNRRLNRVHCDKARHRTERLQWSLAYIHNDNDCAPKKCSRRRSIFGESLPFVTGRINMLIQHVLAITYSSVESAKEQLGEFCPSSAPGMVCSGHGSCVSHPSRATSQCNCDRGYSGEACETHEFALSCPFNCSWPHGRCTKWPKGGILHCVCAEGFSGDGCVDHTPVNCSEPECSGHGECISGKCACFAGYYGAGCVQGCPGYVASTGKPCNGRGICAATGSPGHSADVCKCLTGFQGAACEHDLDGVTTCANGCSDSGTCLHGVCTCYPNYGGSDCSILLKRSGGLIFETGLSKLLAILACFAVTAMGATAAWRWVNAVEVPVEMDLDEKDEKIYHPGVGIAGTRKF